MKRFFLISAAISMLALCVPSFAATIYVSNGNSGATAPYDTPETAAATINEAIASAVAGDVIEVAAGTYILGAGIVIDKAITLRGADKETTIIETGAKLAARNMELKTTAVGALVENFTFSGMHRSASWGATGTALQLNAGTVKNCLFWNARTTQGSQSYVYVTGQDSFLVNCEIRDFFTDNNSRPLHLLNKATADSCLVRNCRIQTSSATELYKFVLVEKGAKLLNSTIAGNTSPNKAYGVEVNASTLKNTIVWANQSNLQGSPIKSSGTCTLENNCDTDPLFVDEQNGDYRLAFGSSCIDTAVAEETPIATADISGNARVVGASPDIGAFEYIPSEDLSVAFTSNSRTAWPDEMITFSSFVANGEGCVYLWNFGDGTTSTEANPTHAYANAGKYTVSLAVTAGGATATKTIADLLFIKPREIFVAQNASNPVYPYATRETATANIADAVALAEDGATVTLLRGTHEIDIPSGTNFIIPITKAVTIRSEDNDPTGTIVRHKNASSNNTRHAFFDIAHPDATVTGISFTNGTLGPQSGGGVIAISSGVVTNCHIFGNTSKACTWALWGLGVNMTGGLLVDCVISNNVAPSGSTDTADSGGCGLWMSGGTAANCLIVENTSSFSKTATNPGGVVRIKGGLLVNSTIANNTLKECAGVNATDSARVVNCVIGGNTATDITAEKAHQAVWAGKTSCFENCVTDKNIVINESCPTVALVGFVDAASHDYRLGVGSPAINAGKETNWNGGLDLDGNLRVMGDAVDAGCYEYDTSAVSFGAIISVSHLEGFAPLNVRLSVVVEGAVGDVAYQWDLDGDGTIDETTDENFFDAVYTTEGRITPSVTVSDGVNETAAVLSSPISVYPKVLYVKAGNENSSFPYSTPETSADNIQDAIDFAADGAEIVILPGEYIISRPASITEQFYSVSRAIWIHGRSGERDQTILRADRTTAQNKTISFFFLMNQDAKVSDLTMVDGISNSGTISALSVIGPQGGMISNCVFRSGMDGAYSSHGGIKLHGGLLTHCAIYDSRVACHNDDLSGAICLLDGVVENCLVTGTTVRDTEDETYVFASGITAKKGVIRSCTVVGNMGTRSGGVYLGSEATMVNSIVVGNRALFAQNYPENAALLKHAGNVTHSIVDAFPESVEAGEGVLVKSLAEVKFADAEEGDYRLKTKSPAVGAGVVIEGAMPAVDLLGENRIYGLRPDMGAIELQRGAGTLLITE